MISSLHNIKQKLLLFAKETDLVLLVFLILILNVSLVVKLAGICFIYLVRRDFKFKILSSRLPKFYFAIIILSLIEYLFNYDRGLNYTLLALLALSFWIASLLITHQLKLAVEKQGVTRIENALIVFFVLNAVVSFLNLLSIMLEIKDMNPYTFSGLGFKYSASTGDYINGITGDLSTTNMIINSFGVFYFLYRKNYSLSLLCFLVAIYTTSNLGNIILFGVSLGVILFDKSRLHKSIVICYLSLLIIFIVRVSPSNLNYLSHKVTKLLHLEKNIIQPHFTDNTSKEELINSYVTRYKTEVIVNKTKKQEISGLIIETEKQAKKEYLKLANNPVVEFTKKQGSLLSFYLKNYGDTMHAKSKPYYDKHPGKYTSFKETFGFLSKQPSNFLFGAGPGNFSSKLAYKASNIGISGKYVKKFVYIAPEFKNNHLKLSLNYLLQPTTEHSIINFPNSVLNQLLGEYGTIGLLLFFIFYVWYFLKRIKLLSYGKILLPLLLLFLLTDYWFENFTIVIMFELMIFLDINRNQKQEEAISA